MTRRAAASTPRAGADAASAPRAVASAARTGTHRARTRSGIRAAALLTALVAGSAALAGCSTAAADRPLVAVTTDILGDVVSEVVGESAEVLVLMPTGADPHAFEVSAREAARVRTADVVVENGLGLEEGIARHVEAAAADGVPVLTAGDAVAVLDWRDGDDSGEDPHFWTDPTQTAAVVRALAADLPRVAPALDADAVRAGADRYLDELDRLDGWMARSFAAVPEERRALVTNHHVFGYLAHRYDFRVVGAVLPSGTTLASPSAADLRELVAAIEAADVPTIFADASQPARLAEVLADEADITVRIRALATESLGPPGEGADTYLSMMRSNTTAIVDGLTVAG